MSAALLAVELRTLMQLPTILRDNQTVYKRETRMRIS
jgi:hypothetical protein